MNDPDFFDRSDVRTSLLGVLDLYNRLRGHDGESLVEALDKVKVALHEVVVLKGALSRVEDERDELRKQNAALHVNAGECLALRASIGTLEQQVERQSTESTSALQGMRVEYDAMLATLKEQHVMGRAMDQHMLAETREALNKAQVLRSSSTRKGAALEMAIVEFLEECCPFAEVVNTSGRAHAMDIQLRMDLSDASSEDSDVLIVAIDAKNYSTNVGQAQLSKWEADHVRNAFDCSVLFTTTNVSHVCKQTLTLVDDNLWRRSNAQYIVTEGNYKALLRCIALAIRRGARSTEDDGGIDDVCNATNAFLEHVVPVTQAPIQCMKAISRSIKEYKPGPSLSALRAAAQELRLASNGRIRTEMVLQGAGANVGSKKRPR